MPAEPQDFKDALSKWATGVTVVTTLNETGHPHGMTVSSFTSVSLNPPLILFCANKAKYGHQAIMESGIFAVNILGVPQMAWGKRFAGMYPDIEDRFADISYKTAVTGAPVFPEALGWVDCRVYQRHEAGDHTIFIGQVEAAGSSATGDALLYFNRQWGHFTPIPKE